MLKQTEQDNIWNHFQNQGQETFNLSFTRLQFLAKRCIPGTRVLNIGVGSGDLEKLLVARGVEVYSLDPCAESIAKLQSELNIGEERAKQGYSQCIPFNAEYFDKVIMTEVLEHLPEEIYHATLDEVLRVLKVEGEFTGTVPYREKLQASEVICPFCHSQFHRWGHHQAFDRASLESSFTQHGFRMKRMCPRCFPDFGRSGLKNFIRAVFRYVLGRMGEQLVGPNLYFIASSGSLVTTISPKDKR
jgi:ubiquinone/menaquinone biosynthesis C-methylase UbiE